MSQQRSRYKNQSGLYHALVVLPDHLFPFKTLVEGKWVRGVRSYDARLTDCERRYGAGHYGYGLGAYRQFFHLAGALLCIVIAGRLAESVFRNKDAILVFLGAAILFISFQEFYLHRRMYEQLWRKGVLDWLVWCVPFVLYLYIAFH